MEPKEKYNSGYSWQKCVGKEKDHVSSGIFYLSPLEFLRQTSKKREKNWYVITEVVLIPKQKCSPLPCHVSVI